MRPLARPIRDGRSPVTYFRDAADLPSLRARKDAIEAPSPQREAALDALQTVIDRLPEHAARVRRRFWRDADFRALCHDYQEALDVLARLERATPPHAAQIAEYRELVSELLAEAAEILEQDTDSEQARS